MEIGDDVGPYPTIPYPEPTNALPGTAEKVAVLVARARRGQHLFHPADAKYTLDETIPTRRRTRGTGSM